MKTTLSLLGKLLMGIGGFLTDLLCALWDALQKRDGYTAEFGSETDIASRFNTGFVISTHRKLNRRKSFENLLICGNTGSGKTVRLLLKTLFSLKRCSLVINDVSGELYQLASGYLNQFFDLIPLNFTDSTVSCGYNILSRIQKPNDINKIAHLLVSATLDKGNGDPFWSLQAKAMLTIFIRLVLHQPKEYRTMANVLHVLNYFAAHPVKVDEWIAKTRDAKLVLEYKALISMPEKPLQSIVATCKAALQLFDDPEIARVTAFDSIDFDRLRKRPTIIFLHNSVADQKYVATLTATFFEQLYGHILKRLPEKDELDLFIILEEASSMYIQLLPLALANCRKARAGTLCCIQSVGQLKSMYKEEADNILSQCVTKLFLPGQTSMETLRDLETLGGKYIHIDEKKKERVMPLLSVDQIRTMPANRTLILSGNKPFIQGRTSPYYKSFKYKAYTQIPPLPLRGDIPAEPLQLMQ